MPAFPNFSNFQSFVKTTLNSRKSNSLKISNLNPFVRIASGAGYTLVSNTDATLMGAAGIYGTADSAYRPKPIVTSLEVDEGAGNLSRKASISITAFSKSSMETLTKYFLEPGFSLFIEWGWGVGGYKGLQSLNASTVCSFSSAVATNAVRQNTQGNYDNYLGFITGGGVSVDGDKWIININCTGYTELPTYLLTSETGEQKTNDSGILSAAKIFGLNFIDSTNSGPSDERFMRMFNELPQTRQTKAVKGLRKNPNVNSLSSFINFDSEVSEKINGETDGWTIPWTDIQIFRSSLKVDGVDVIFPKGTKIISDDKFIRFDTLMRIIYEIGIEGYELPGSRVITTKVDYEDTACSAFKYMFSTDASKLFIPNPNTPKIKLSGAPIGAGTPVSSITANVTDNSISGIQFPSQAALSFTPKIGNTITKPAQQWGYLKNLYVNFNFAKSVLETKNFYLKDALYQILNGISSAVNGMWNFQIEESEVGNTTILKIWEMNMISSTKGAPYTFDMVGQDSIFIDASLDLDISGAKMNQIIGQKLGQTLNGDSARTPKTLFQSGLTDKFGIAIKKKKIETTDDADTQTPQDKTSVAEENLNVMLGKAKYFPKVDLTDANPLSGELYDMCYLGAYHDSAIFSALKNGNDQIGEKDTASPLMPINFTFKVHGISGIRRGDMFKVNGIPSIYNNGFFQVLSVKHTVDGMQWTTEVTGGYRNNS
jgi:hypothetical protein